MNTVKWMSRDLRFSRFEIFQGKFGEWRLFPPSKFDTTTGVRYMQKKCHAFLDGYYSTVQGFLDWVEVDIGFHQACLSRVIPSPNRGTQHLEPRNPGFKPRFVPSRPQENGVTMWRNRHICTKFQENRHIFGSTKKIFFETWRRHIEPGIWRFVTKMWCHSFLSPSHNQNQV